MNPGKEPRLTEDCQNLIRLATTNVKRPTDFSFSTRTMRLVFLASFLHLFTPHLHNFVPILHKILKE